MAKRIRCEYCDKPVRLSNLKYSYEYRCPRCDNIIYRPGASKTTVVLISISTLFILFFALFSPLLSVNIIGDIDQSIVDTLKFLFQKDIFSGVFLSLTIIVVPILMNIFILLITLNKYLSIPFSLVKRLVASYLFMKEWNMIEVYFVGLLISMVKLYELSTVTLLAGFWINAIYVLMLYINLIIFNPLDYAHINTRKPIKENSIFMVILFLFLAFIFIPPSNILPIMPTYQYAVTYDNNIFIGIKAFWDDGDRFVPIVIFFASICIPLLKIIGLIVMILMAKYDFFIQYRKFATKYYIITDRYGKYSLLDVYVVVFASAYIQYDDLVRIGIGYAIVPFTLVVVFTMVASKYFDTRLLWKKEYIKENNNG